MSKNPLSVWSFPYATHYYLKHPWVWFKHAFRNIKDGFRRARYGWTYSDVWDMDQWIMYTFPPMLRHMADKGSAYPGHEPFETAEKWHKWLHAMADLLESGLEDKQDECNEYYKEYMDHLFDPNDIRVTEMDRDYYNRSQELMKDAEDNVANAMRQLGEHFYSLWD